MKTKIKIVVGTFVATTAFWSLAIVALFRFQEQPSGVDIVTQAHERGFTALLRASNEESKPVTFRVEEIISVKPATESIKVLLEREVLPSGEFWIGIKKTVIE